MTNQEFCKVYSSFYGEKIEKPLQIKQVVLNGQELKELIEFFYKSYEIKLKREQVIRNIITSNLQEAIGFDKTLELLKELETIKSLI